MFYVYILKSEDGKTYLGYSSDLKRRVLEHNDENNKGSTRNKKWELVYYEAYRTKELAFKREQSLKKNRKMKSLLLKRI